METTHTDDSIEPTATRRGVLRSTVGLATASVLGTVATSGAAAEPTDYIPTTPEEIRAAFAEVPYNDDPSELDREIAEMRYPEGVIRDDGAVPDPEGYVYVEAEAPRWALAIAYERARRTVERGGQPDRWNTHDVLLEEAYANETYVLPDGSDAVDAILAAVGADQG